MYMTRMRLDLNSRQTMKALVAPNLFHGAIERSFEGERKRNLWRIDNLNGVSYLILLSTNRPDLASMVCQFGVKGSSTEWETKDYTPLLERIQPGSKWRFRLVANPTKSCLKGEEDISVRGKVHAHVSVQYQETWLSERAEKYGFSIKPEEFTVVHSQWYKFRKGTDKGHLVSLLAVTYEGSLTVTDVDLFRQALTNGIGRGKAYGLGLLTIIR